ncbi:unnamed protein product [Trichobilharzia regenti]|nr:unnamed protein product [Trichobilharzia regenti]
MDIYLEAYNHVISRESRRRLAQMMTDLMFKRPRIDFSENYFVKAYRYECAILRQRTEVMRSILTHQVCLQIIIIKVIVFLNEWKRHYCCFC